MTNVIRIGIILALCLSPAHAATCEEGVVAVEQMSKILGLAELEQASIDALIAKARIQEEQGRQRDCKIIVADAIRFFLIKTVID